MQEAFRKTRDVLLVLDSHNEDTVRHVRGFYGAALRAAGVHVDLWESDLRGPPSSRILGAYRHGAVIWATPQYERALPSRSSSTRLSLPAASGSDVLGLVLCFKCSVANDNTVQFNHATLQLLHRASYARAKVEVIDGSLVVPPRQDLGWACTAHTGH